MARDPRLLKDTDLLSIIEDKENAKDTEVPSDNTVIQFLADFSIYPGTNKIASSAIYRLYKNAYPDNHVNSLEFHMLLKGYLEHTTGYLGRVDFYKVNNEPKKLVLQLAAFL